METLVMTVTPAMAAEWLIVHEQEREKTRKAKQNEADDFLIGQTDRAKTARYRDYMRGYKRR